jgi:hypothetical protein
VDTYLDILASYGFQHDWKFEVADNTSLTVPIKLARGEVLCIARLYPDIFEFRSLLPFRVPESKRTLMMDFVSRINCHALVATLFFDCANGEIGVETAAPVATGWLCPAVIDPIVRINLAAIDRWLPGVAAVCYSDVSPNTAIALCGAPCPIAAVVGEAVKKLESFGDDEDQSMW